MKYLFTLPDLSSKKLLLFQEAPGPQEDVQVPRDVAVEGLRLNARPILDELKKELEGEALELLEIDAASRTLEQQQRFYFLDAVVFREIDPSRAKVYAANMMIDLKDRDPEEQKILAEVYAEIYAQSKNISASD